VLALNVLDVADCIRNSQWNLQQATPPVHNRVAAYVVAGSGIFENQL
jgi:hypothetical protein